MVVYMLQRLWPVSLPFLFFFLASACVVAVQEEIDMINAKRFTELEKKLASDMDSFGRAQMNAAVIHTERTEEAADKDEKQQKNKQTATQRYMASLEWNQRYTR